MPDQDMQKQLDDTKTEISSLRNRIQQLEQGPGGNLPRTWPLDRSFLKRAFTVWGHSAVAGLIIAVPFWVVLLIIIGITSAFRY